MSQLSFFSYKRYSRWQMSLLLLTLAGVFVSVDANAQKAKTSETKTGSKNTKPVLKPNYWYIGAEFFSPFIYDDLYSWGKDTKFNMGAGLQLKGGYQFSSVFGLEANIGVGRNYMNTSSFQKDYVLGVYDAYTYYPYILINGTTFQYSPSGVIGEQGNNPNAVQVEGVRFDKIRSRVRFVQSSLNATFNVTRMFYASTYREKPVELWLRPGVYLSRFWSQVYNTETGEKIAPRVNRSRTWGLGGDIALRFNLSPYWAIDVNNRLIWERDHSIDGVLNAKRAYDSYIWQPSVGLVYKFRKKGGEAMPSSLPAEMEMDFNQPMDLYFSYPEEVELPSVKKRFYSSVIRLNYPLNQSFIAEDLKNNARELERLNRELSVISGNPDYTVRSIKVEGFASPEGPYENNRRLAESRASSIIDYVVGHSDLGRGMFTVGRISENWQGLRDTLQRDANLPGRDRLLSLMDRTKDTERLKVELKKEPAYDYLVKNVYPALRLSSYTVEYDVKSHKGEEAKALIEKNPSDLSPEEMYAVASAYGLGSEQSDRVIEILFRHYPAADISRSYKGVQLLAEGRYPEAVDELEAVNHKSAEVLNALGVAYAYKGDMVSAKKYLLQAAAGSGDARKNLRRLSFMTIK